MSLFRDTSKCILEFKPLVQHDPRGFAFLGRYKCHQGILVCLKKSFVKWFCENVTGIRSSDHIFQIKVFELLNFFSHVVIS
jgi:hypothetical protein